MKQYDVKTVDGVDFIYIGNDVNGNCKYAVNFRHFLNGIAEEQEGATFEERRVLAWYRAKNCGFEKELKSHLEPFFVIRPYGGNFVELKKKINYAKSWLKLKKSK